MGEIMTEMTADSASRSRLRVILAASIGSAREWYDFFLYGTAAPRFLGQLCRARRLRRQSAGGRRVRAGAPAAARGPDVVGLAHSVPGELPADHGWHLRSPAHCGNTCLYRGGGGARQDRA